MLRESERRSEAARLLDASDMSDSGYLLRLLAFELLLKIAYEHALGREAPKHHMYEVLFEGLPPTLQAELMLVARERIGPSALDANPRTVLQELGRNFIDLRYPYERYRGMSEAEYLELGNRWVANGAPLSGATFRYHPEELFGLTFAHQAHVDRL